MSATTGRPLALVTGATSGIGFELAKQFAGNGFDLIIAAEDAELTVAERDLRAAGGDVECVRVDLAIEDGVKDLYRRVAAEDRPLDAAALNAGIAAGGAFVDTELSDELELIDRNVRSTVQLSKYIVRDMLGRGEGRILYTSSIASTMPGSFQAVYDASRSFVQSFALALRNELKDTGVTVTLLMPGPTETEFFERADMLDTQLGASEKDDPADVARQGRGSRLIPDSVRSGIHRTQAEPGSD